jgi:thiol:disulfide interchange protein DsbC
MMQGLSKLSVLLLGGLTMSASFADADQEARDAIIASLPEISAEDIQPSPVNGLYEVQTGSQVAYISADGQFLIQGDIFNVETEVNLTESRRSVGRLGAVEDLGESSMLVFSPEEVRHTITVFTDIDCGYCRKLHRQIADYNESGIKVRYLFYPRSGPNTDSWHKAENVWCADDRNTALTQAKAGAVIDSEDCGETPVGSHYALGQSFGIRGTPAILTDSGELIGGYLPPDELLSHLE